MQILLIIVSLVTFFAAKTSLSNAECDPQAFGEYQLIHKPSNLVVGIPIDSENEPVRLYKRDDISKHSTIYFRVSLNSKIVISFASRPSFEISEGSKEKGAKLITHNLGRNESLPHQQFLFEKTIGGDCLIVAQHVNRYLGVHPFPAKEGSILTLGDEKYSPNEDTFELVKVEYEWEPNTSLAYQFVHVPTKLSLGFKTRSISKNEPIRLINSSNPDSATIVRFVEVRNSERYGRQYHIVFDHSQQLFHISTYGSVDYLKQSPFVSTNSKYVHQFRLSRAEDGFYSIVTTMSSFTLAPETNKENSKIVARKNYPEKGAGLFLLKSVIA